MDIPLPTIYIWWSSAYIFKFAISFMWYDRSFWYKFHSVGPKEDPWGHPRFITFQSLVALPTFTLLSRSMVIITSWFAIAARSRVLARLVVSLAQIGELARRLNQQQSKRRLEHSFRIVKQLPFHFASEILKKCLNIPKHFLNISKNPLHISK